MSVKRLHRRGRGGVDVLPHQHVLDSDEDHSDVRPQRAVVHIPHIQFELLRPTDSITTMTLRPTADARSHLMPTCLLL